MNENEKHIEEFIKGIEFDDAPNQNHRDSLERELLRAFPKHRLQRTAAAVWKWRIIMNNRITKFAAAAVIVAAVLAGLNMISQTGSIALADVLENVMNIRAYAYRMRTTDADTPDYTEFQILASRDYGQVAKVYVPDEVTGEMKFFSASYTVFSKEIIVAVMPRDKLYAEIKMTNELLKGAEQDNGSPIFFLEEFIKHPLTELGTSYIDAVKVVGYESTDLTITEDAGRSEARLWVDVETQLPVKIEAETYDQNGILISKMTTDSFEWDLQVDSAEFEPVIPDDYAAIGELEFSADEKNVISGLRFYAKIFDGKYPDSLAVKQLTLSNQIQQAVNSEVGGKMYAGKSQDQIMKELGQGCMDLEFTVIFYGMIASQNKAIAYYGDRVTADHPDAVLMRWREDDGRYMVIFGDLSIKKVTEKALAELEAMPLIQNSK